MKLTTSTLRKVALSSVAAVVGTTASEAADHRSAGKLAPPEAQVFLAKPAEPKKPGDSPGKSPRPPEPKPEPKPPKDPCPACGLG